MKGIIKTTVYLQIFLYIVLGNAFTINLGNRAPLKIAEIFSIIPIFLYLISNIKIKRGASFYTKFIVLFSIIDLVSIIINTFIYQYTLSEIMYGLIYLARIFHIFLLAFVLFKLVQANNVGIANILRFINFCFIFVCLIGFIQYKFFPIAKDWYDLFGKFGFYWADPDPHHDRLVSTYMDPNYLASILIIPITINACFLLFSEKKQKKYPYILSLLIYLIAIILSQSRSGLVGLVISASIIYIAFASKQKYKLKYVLFAMTCIIIFFILLFSSNIMVFVKIRNFATDKSASHRFDSWLDSFDYLKTNYLLGVGYNLFSSYLSRINLDVINTSSYGLDSSILFLCVTTGLFGFILFLIATYKIIIIKNNNPLCLSIKIIFVSSLIISFFNNLLFYTLWLFPFLFLILLLSNTRALTDNKNEGVE